MLAYDLIGDFNKWCIIMFRDVDNSSADDAVLAYGMIGDFSKQMYQQWQRC